MSKFKVGDKAALYTPNGRFVVTVENTTDFNGQFIYVRDTNGFSGHYHPKQLRKLKKKEPRYICIHTEDLNLADPTGQNATVARICVNQGNYKTDKYWTKVKVVE